MLGRVALDQLRIARNDVERRPYFTADPDDIAALGEVGGFGHLLGALQLDIGLAVRLDLLDQHDRLAVALLLGRALVLAGQHEIPGYEDRKSTRLNSSH